VALVQDGRGSPDTTPAAGRGGPFLALLRKLKVLRDNRHHRELPFAALIAFTWLPIVALAAASHQARRVLSDFSIHARLLVSLPLLYEADVVLSELVGITLGCFAGARVAQGLDPRSLDDVRRRAEGLRSSSAGEAACLLLALVVGPLAFWGRTGGPSGVGALNATPLSPAVLWYGWVSLPTFSFLLFRGLWRWLIWAWTLWRISRLDLRLVPTHPDSSGGLGVLVIPNRGFSLFVAAVAAGVAGVWGSKIIFHGARLTSFGPPAAMLLAISLLVGLGPLLVFSRKLLGAKIAGRARYGSLAWDYTTQFDERWIVHNQREGLLGTADLQSLADLANSYSIVRKMRLVPFDRVDLLVLVASVLVPLSPLVLTEVPLKSLLKMLADAVL
jgi:hypothetical protein